MFVTSIIPSDALTMGFVVLFNASTKLFILVLVMLGDLSVDLYNLIEKSTTPVSHSYCLLPKSHVEKNFGLISTSMPSPFFERFVISFAAGCSSVPRYFILIFSALWDNSFWVFYYSCVTFTFDSFEGRTFIINRKINTRSILQILSFLS